MADLKISQLTGATTPLAGTEEVPLVQSGTTKKVTVANLTAGRNITAAKGLFGGATASAAACEVVAGSSSVAQGYLVADSSGNSQLRFLINGAYSGGMYNVGAGVVIANNGAVGQNIGISVDGGGSNAWTFNTASNLTPNVAGKGVAFTANTPAAGMTSQLLNWYEEGTWTPAYTTTGTDFTSVTYSQQVGRYTRIGRMVYIYIRILTTGFTGGSGSLQIKNLPFTANSNTDDATVPVTFAFGWASNPAVVAGIVGNTTKMTLYYSLVNQECPYNAIDASGNSYLRMAGCYEAA